MPRFLALLAGLLVSTIATAQTSANSSDSVRHTVILVGNTAGAQVATVRSDGTREIAYEYNDRGRGPKLTTRIKVNAEGLPVSVETSGNDYMKAPVTERFALENGVARWKNDAESGEKKLSGPAFYLSMQSVPEELGLLVNALLKAPGQRLQLLPEGEASVRKVGELTLGSGAASRRVVSYEITGVNFTPDTVWLDTDGRFFAFASSWTSFVREGWESSLPQLLANQETRASARSEELARTLTRKPSGPLAIVNANLFDADTGKSIPGATVLIEGNRIKAVGSARDVAVPAGAEKIDARGKSLLPGLWDMHVHLSPNDGLLHMAAGVTSVRDLANDNDTLQGIKKRVEAGTEIGPRIEMTGFIDGRGPFAGPTKVFADSPEEARTAVDNYAKLGYTGIKVYSSLKPELMPVIVKAAHEKGLRVSGHVPAYMSARQFVEAGVDEMQHINFVFLNFYFDQVKDTRSRARFIEVAERGATLDLKSPEVRSFVQLLKDRHTVVDPTVTVFYEMFVSRAGKVGPAYAPIADRLPPQVRRGLLTGGLPVPEGKDQRYRDSADALLKMVKLLYDSGVTLVPGTDGLPGFTLHRELEMYVQAGIPAPEVLRIATINSARVLKHDREVGSIAAGKLADMILVDGDPARRISDIRNTELVIKDGKVIESAAVLRSIGVRPR